VGLENVETSIKENTKLIWVETPTNPLINVIDIKKVSKLAKKHHVLTAVDSTFATPIFQKPIKLGADIVMHSTTKYIGGHNDVMGGALLTNRKKIDERMLFARMAVGLNPSPFDCWLILRGTKTLELRMKKHEENAFRVARFLESHPKVKRVRYPGLKSHPQHKIASKQMSGFGGMLAFELKADLKTAKRFTTKLKVISLAESLGGANSLIDHPASMTHASLPKEERIKVGVTDSLLRLSVGLENVEDLIRDLDFALSSI